MTITCQSPGVRMSFVRNIELSMEAAVPDSQRDSQRFSALFSAWVDARMAGDRSLLSLSVGGIGFGITLATTLSDLSAGEGVALAGMILSFLCCASVILRVFRSSADLARLGIEQIDGDAEQVQKRIDTLDERLKRLDWVTEWSFNLGVFLGLVFGFVRAVV